MERHIIKKLAAWKSKDARKPLILKGARQVGKTYALKEFAAQHFPRVFYINFEKQVELKSLFQQNLDPHRIVNELGLFFKKAINVPQDLLIFDEIQACPEALTSLKYFCEDMPELALCSAGSLLGIHLNTASFPVGKVDWLDMYPMSFEEFLSGIGEQPLVDLINSVNTNSRIPEIAHIQLWQHLKNYLIVGGLPEVVSLYRDHQKEPVSAFQHVREKQIDLLKDYYSDIAKHSGKINAMHIDRVWNAVPAQLAKSQNASTNKFKFKGVVPNVDRYRRLANTIDWLLNTGLLHKVPVLHTCQQPLKAYSEESSFKLFMFDVGILGAMAGLSPETILKYDYGTYKGYFAENFVCQELIAEDSKPLYNWREKNSEVEFLKDVQGDIIPLEVKSGAVTRSKSLKNFAEKYHPTRRVILSANKKSMNYQSHIYKLPLYLTSKVVKLLTEQGN